jgi:hypothetical protein
MFNCTVCGSSLDVDEASDLCPECSPAAVWDLATEEEDWFEADQMRERWLQFGLESERVPTDGSTRARWG